MGMCYLCKSILPPDVMIGTMHDGVQECAFCKSGKDPITLEDDYGNTRKVTKQEMMGRYKEFTKKVKDRPELKKLLVKDKKLIMV